METQARGIPGDQVTVNIINPRDPDASLKLTLPRDSSVYDVKQRISQHFPGNPRPDTLFLIAGRNLGDTETLGMLAEQQQSSAVVVMLIIRDPSLAAVEPSPTAAIDRLEAEEKDEPDRLDLSPALPLVSEARREEQEQAADAHTQEQLRPPRRPEEPNTTAASALALDASAYSKYCQLWETQQHLWWMQLHQQYQRPAQEVSPYLRLGDGFDLRRRVLQNVGNVPDQPPQGAGAPAGGLEPLPGEARAAGAQDGAAQDNRQPPVVVEERRFIINLQPFLFLRLVLMVFLFAQRGHLWRNILIACLAFGFYLWVALPPLWARVSVGNVAYLGCTELAHSTTPSDDLFACYTRPRSYHTGIVAVGVALLCPWLLRGEPPAQANAAGDGRDGHPDQAQAAPGAPPGEAGIPEQGPERGFAGGNPLPLEPMDPEWLQPQQQQVAPRAAAAGAGSFVAAVRQALVEFFASLVPSREPPVPVPRPAPQEQLMPAAGDGDVPEAAADPIFG